MLVCRIISWSTSFFCVVCWKGNAFFCWLYDAVLLVILYVFFNAKKKKEKKTCGCFCFASWQWNTTPLSVAQTLISLRPFGDNVVKHLHAEGFHVLTCLSNLSFFWHTVVVLHASPPTVPSVWFVCCEFVSLQHAPSQTNTFL